MRVALSLLGAAGAALVVTLACGPSVQSIHEGTVRFEHCYRLDVDTEVGPGYRDACWRNWVRRYTYGQSRDRIEYARRRLRAIERGESASLALDLESDPDRRPQDRQFYLTVPEPTSADAPPPPIDVRSYSPARGEARSAPGDGCLVRCRRVRAESLEACRTEALEDPSSEALAPGSAVEEPAAASGASRPSAGAADLDAGVGVDACSQGRESDYKDCVRRCFD